MGAGAMSLLDDLDARRERALRDRENAARLAQAYAVFTTEGDGTIHYEDRIPFGLTFIEKPVAAYACEVDVDDVAERAGLADDEINISLPVCTGYVTGWDRDERDFYTGCWVAVVISGGEIGEGSFGEVKHHFTFAAIALKDIPVDSTDAVE